MGYNLKNARNGKSISKIPKWAKFEVPSIKKMRFYDGLNFKKIKKICMEKVAGEQGLGSGTILIHAERLQISDAPRKQNESI